MKKIAIMSLVLLGTLSVFSACGKKESSTSTSSNSEEKVTTIRVGMSSNPYSDLFTDAVKPILEKEGYKVENVEFTEFIQADVALAEGSVDMNIGQHTAYLDNFNENKQADLVGIVKVPTIPAVLYPGVKTSLDDISAGDSVGIPNDASNAARAYNILQKAGWITLKEGIDPVKATKEDIESNPYELDIVEMASMQIPRSLDDLDYGVMPGSVISEAGLDNSKVLLYEDILPDLEIIVAVQSKNKDTDWAKAVVAAYKSDEFKEYMDEHNKDNYWYIPED